MPTGMVKRLWFNTQNVLLMANPFNLSVEAMTIRLEILGLIGTPKQTPRVYFRTHGVLISHGWINRIRQPCSSVACQLTSW